MDAGGVALVGAVAAVVGAALGAGGAIRAAQLTGRFQAKTQHVHWRRQVRRDAYAAFMAAASREKDALRSIETRLWTGVPAADVHSALTDLASGGADLDSASAVVRIEGPEDLGWQAVEIHGARNKYLVALLHETGHPLASGHQQPSWSSEDGRSEMGQKLLAFQRNARNVLDDPKGALRTSP